jgi:hypothetical protein
MAYTITGRLRDSDDPTIYVAEWTGSTFIGDSQALLAIEFERQRVGDDAFGPVEGPYTVGERQTRRSELSMFMIAAQAFERSAIVMGDVPTRPELPLGVAG